MDDAIKKYIERALELAERRDDELSDESLAEIARELGLSDEDLARVEQAIEDHLERGRGYVRHGMWDDGIREFEDASTLAPSRVAIHLALADALTRRWKDTDFPDDKTRAVQLAREVLDVEPEHEDAYRLLAELEQVTTPPPTERAPTADADSRRRLAVTVAALGVVVLTGMTAAVVMLKVSDDATPAHTNIPPKPPDIIKEIKEFKSGEADLPVQFAGSDGLKFEARRSRLATYPDRAFYTLWGDFEVTGDYEVERIDIRLQLLDGDGKQVKATSREAWGSHEATLRKGDHGIFTLLIDADPAAKSVVLDVSLVEKHPASGPYAEAPVIEPVWFATPPDHLKLEVRERHAGFSPAFSGEKGFFKATWEFRNVGEVPIRALKYEVNLYDDHGEKLDSRRKLATFSSHPAMEPGDVFLESTIASVAASYARYEIVITEIE